MIGFVACNTLIIGVAEWFSPHQKDISSIHTKDELLKKFGNPTSEDTIILKHGINLYEFQGGLYKFIPKNDSLTVIESIYEKGFITTALWYEPLDSDSIRIIDNLTWNHVFTQY